MLRMAYCLLVAKDSVVPSLPLLKPSRPGELCQIIWDVPHKDGSYSCAENKTYHGLHAGSTSVNGGKGFRGWFLTWWSSRPLRFQGSPHELPFTIPSVSTALAIFRDFQANFRKLESRHQRHRHELLSAQFQEHQDKLFAMVKTEGKAHFSIWRIKDPHPSWQFLRTNRIFISQMSSWS